MKKYRRLVALMLLAALLIQPVLAANVNHGTSNQEITEDMLTLTPPADYAVNANTQGKAQAGKYNAYFPKDRLQTVSIEIEENNLNYLLQNAGAEPYVMATSVTVGDTTLGWCGLRTKGNYTLHHSDVSNPGSDRFSFTVNFGKYIKKEQYGETQNFYGCDKISFNNFFFDKSMLKEYFAFKLMEEMGLPTPQHALAKLYINGQYYGVYFMVESLDHSVLEQHWNMDKDDLSVYLCKPTGTNFLYQQIQSDPSPLYEYDEATRLELGDAVDVAVEWVRKLNCLSSGTDFQGNAIDVNSQEYTALLAQVMDVDEALRYFAAHSWLCQMDNMFTVKQNFGLYLSPEGVSTLIPWDYDLSFGCYYPSTAELTANYPVDVMFQIDSRLYGQAELSASKVYANFPLFNVLFQNEQLRHQYRDYMLDCSRIAALGGTVDGKSYAPGWFASFVERLQEELLAAASEPLAENVYYMNRIRQPRDIQKALPNIKKIIALRAVGVWSQVAGAGLTVSASGCDLESLGNGMWGDSSTRGELLVVNPNTGIFFSAEFEGTKRGAMLNLVVEPVEPESQLYTQLEDQIAPGITEEMTAFRLTATGNVSGDYTLTVPVSPGEAEKEITFYSFANGELTRLDMERDGNLFTCTLPKLSVIVKVVPGSAELYWAAALIAALLLTTAATALVLRKRRPKDE